MATLLPVLSFHLLLNLFIFSQFSVFSLPDDLLWFNLKTPNNQTKWHFKYLHESGCCEDRVECREREKETNYGDRIFRSVEASAAFEDPEDNSNFVHAILFRQIIAAHKNISDETLHPKFGGLSSTYDMTRKPEKGDPRLYESVLMYSPAAEDCELDHVRAWMHYNGSHIFVCRRENGSRIIIRNTLNLLIETSKESFIIDTKKDCEDASIEDETLGHPAMCEENLIDLLAIPEDGNKTVITVVAYVEEDGMDVNGNRMINVKVWENKRMINSSKKYEGRLASIYWYRLDPQNAHGMYFTTDAFVCKFEHERGKGELSPDRFMFEKEQKLCRPMAVYLECPQGWCYEIGMTTSFTIEGNDGFFYVYFTKGIYHWRIKTRTIPMTVPRVNDALYYGSAEQNIIREGEKYKGIDNVAPYPPVMIFDATAAFRIQFKDMNYTFSYHPSHGWTSVPDQDYYIGSKGYLVREEPDSQSNLFVDISPEAAFFDNNEAKLYLFEGSKYTVYEVVPGAKAIADDKAWKKVEGSFSVAYLGFNESDKIQEIITLGENRNFILNATHFYHSVGDIRTSKKELRFSFTELFRVQSECYYNDYTEFKRTLNLYGIAVHDQTVFDRKYEEKPLKAGEAEPYKWEATAIVLIIAVGVAVAVIGSVAMLTYGNMKGETETKVIKHYSAPFLKEKKPKLKKAGARPKIK